MTAHTEPSTDPIAFDPVAIDQMTGGAISASNALIRAALIKAWLESVPAPSYEQLREVNKLLSAKDKGAARQVKEVMDEIKKIQHQDALNLQWTQKAQALLGATKLNIADAMAWQRDAAKEGAHISKEPMATLRGELSERVRHIEDLQHRAQVQREAAVLLVQRIEVLSTKFWEEAKSQEETLKSDVERWRVEHSDLLAQSDWLSVDPKHAPALQVSAQHLKLVWEAFSAALTQASASAADPTQALPAVPAWADQIKQKRVEQASAPSHAGGTGGGDVNAAQGPGGASRKSPKVEVDPALRAKAKLALSQSMAVLERELSEGHGKASVGAAADLRQHLKEYAGAIDSRTERQAQSLLLAAGELVDWQRWRADQLRAELVAKAEGLLQRAKPRVEVKGAKAGLHKNNAHSESGVQTQPSEHSENSGEENNSESRDSAVSQISLEANAAAIYSKDGAFSASVEGADAQQTHADSELHASSTEMVEEQKHQDTQAPQSKDDRDTLSASLERLSPSQTLQDLSIGQEGEVAKAVDQTDLEHGESPASSVPESVAHSTAPVAKQLPSPDYVPTMGPRKLQEALRKLREDWKQIDQGGVPNHALWKRFDNACNLAYPFVHEWLQQTKAQSLEHKNQRLELIEEVKAWSLAHSQGPDWRAVQRALHEFSEKWRTCGHVSEKVYTELNTLWKEAIHQAHLPLETLQKNSIAARKALIEEAKVLGAQSVLRIDPIKALQQRWQEESHVVPIDRKLAQRLWDDFKKPIDEAFQRKSAERVQMEQSMNAHDAAVLKAASALEQAIKEGDAVKIKTAVQHLQNVSVHGEAVPEKPAPEKPAEANTATPSALATSAPSGEVNGAQSHTESAASKSEVNLGPNEVAPELGVQSSHGSEGTQSALHEREQPLKGNALEAPLVDAPKAQSAEAETSPSPLSAPLLSAPLNTSPPKAVVAVRGDDRPGAKRSDSRSTQDPRAKTAGAKHAHGADAQRSKDPRFAGAGQEFRGQRSNRDSQDARVARGPRLGDAAFRAQRQALEAAELAMRKLSAQAHGQTLTNLMSAWRDKQPELIPALKELGSRVNANQRAVWVKAMQSPEKPYHNEALLRLEMASDVPTPAEDLQARRALQLKLLTKRNDPAPSETWAQDAATIFESPFAEDVAKRLQAALKVLLKH